MPEIISVHLPGLLSSTSSISSGIRSGIGIEMIVAIIAMIWAVMNSRLYFFISRIRFLNVYTFGLLKSLQFNLLLLIIFLKI